MPTELQRLDSLLRAVAAGGGTLTYHAAAQAIGLAPPHVIQQIAALLESLMDEDAAQGRPFRAALVVSRAGDGLPGPGFFEKAAQLGRFTEASGAPAAYHAAECAAAQAGVSE